MSNTSNLLDIPRGRRIRIAVKYERSHSFGCCDLIKYLDSTKYLPVQFNYN